MEDYYFLNRKIHTFLIHFFFIALENISYRVIIPQIYGLEIYLNL